MQWQAIRIWFLITTIPTFAAIEGFEASQTKVQAAEAVSFNSWQPVRQHGVINRYLEN